MKKKQVYCLAGALVLVLSVGVIAWKLLHKEDYGVAKALPKDITMVARINPQATIIQNGFSLDWITKAFDENETGIDLQTNSFLFSSEGYLGAILPIDSEKNFKVFAEKHGCEWESQRGMMWTSLNGNILMCLYDNCAMLMGPATIEEQGTLRNTIATCMKQKSNDSGMESKIYSMLMKRDEPVAMACNLDAVPQKQTESLDNLLPEGVSRKDIMLTAGLTMQDNTLRLATNIIPQTKQSKQFVKDLNNVLTPLSNPVLHREKHFASVCYGLDGEQLLQLLRQNPQTRTMLLAANMAIDLDMMINAVKGDVSITFPKQLSSKMFATAQLTNSDFVANIPDWNEASIGLQVIPFRNDYYICSFQDIATYFGVQDNTLTFSNSQELVLQDAESPVQLPDAVGKRFYANVNVKTLNSMLQLLIGKKLGVENMTISATDCSEWVIELKLNNE